MSTRRTPYRRVHGGAGRTRRTATKSLCCSSRPHSSSARFAFRRASRPRLFSCTAETKAPGSARWASPCGTAERGMCARRTPYRRVHGGTGRTRRTATKSLCCSSRPHSSSARFAFRRASRARLFSQSGRDEGARVGALGLALRNGGEGHVRAKNTLSPSTRRNREDAKDCNKILVLFFARSLVLSALRVQKCFAPSAVLTERPRRKRQLYALSLARWNEAIAFAMGAGS